MPFSHFWSLTRETTWTSLKGRNSISQRDCFWKPLEPLKIQSSAGKNSLWRSQDLEGQLCTHYEWPHQASHTSFLAMLPTQSPALDMLTRFPAQHRSPERKRPSGTVHSCCDRWRGENKFDTAVIATEAQWPRLPWLFYLPVTQALTLLKDQTPLCLFITLILFSTQLYYLFRLAWERLSERLK